MTSHISFNFVTKSVSAYDAVLMFADRHRWNREYQLAKAASGDPNHEIEFGFSEGREDELAPMPGDPTSPPIESVALSTSGFYVELRFKDSPMYMTIPATSTVTLGWLERATTDT